MQKHLNRSPEHSNDTSLGFRMKWDGAFFVKTRCWLPNGIPILYYYFTSKPINPLVATRRRLTLLGPRLLLSAAVYK